MPAPPAGHALEPVGETEAFQQFSQENQTDFAKLIFLMNYYHNADFVIVFDGAEYTPQFAFPFAQIYLFTHYRNEEPAKWIKAHCYRSPFLQNIIYFRYPDGSYEVARDVILQGYADLENALQGDLQRGA